MEMWRLISKLIIILNGDTVTANYCLNQVEVTWKEAQTVCSVPSVNDIVCTENNYSGLPTTFSAWTSSASVNHTSDWASFYGCQDVNQNMINPLITLNEYFRNSIEATAVNSVFECAYLCTKRADYFTFVKHICKCIHEGDEIKTAVKKSPSCFKPDSKKHIDDVYSESQSALPIFKFETDFQKKNLTMFNGKDQRYHCMGTQNDYFTIFDCNYSMEYRCADHFILGRSGNWNHAINSCLLSDKTLLKDLDIIKNGWLDYFQYTEGCIDINIPREDKQRLSDHFGNINLSFIADRDDVFQCAFHCTNLNYFVYYMNFCICLTSIENYPVIDSTGCVTICHDDSVFCSSGFGLPLFKYRTDLDIVRPIAYSSSYHCVYKKDGYNFDRNCYSSSHYFKCDGKDNIGHPMKWANAINYCTNLNSKLSKTVGNVSLDVWSRYFRYQILSPDTNNERRKCVAVFINRNKRSNSNSIKWSHYQYRNCSDLLPFICIGDINTNSNITSVTREHINTNVTDISTTQIPSNYSEKMEIDVIVKVNIVLLMLSIVMIVLFSVRVCCKKKTDPK
ncbi:uncharacterized protein [Mytilus edulis]|uniref:uncharacterized protein n=1 Tax=Mytilus edulis TaxID=6550 RepID=UPI0039EF36A4